MCSCCGVGCVSPEKLSCEDFAYLSALTKQCVVTSVVLLATGVSNALYWQQVKRLVILGQPFDMWRAPPKSFAF